MKDWYWVKDYEPGDPLFRDPGDRGEMWQKIVRQFIGLTAAMVSEPHDPEKGESCIHCIGGQILKGPA